MKFLNNELVYLWLVIAALCIMAGCSKENGNSGDNGSSERFISSVVIGSDYSLSRGDSFIIKGIGFSASDEIVFRRKDNDSELYKGSVLSFNNSSISVTIPQTMPSGYWNILCVRKSKEQLLGWARFTIDTLPKDVNIYGSVKCQGVGVEGVYVSDGEKIVKSDRNGIYTISSSRKSGYVFIIIPSGYEAPVDKSLPQFWKPLNDGVKEYDFTLSKVNNNKYIMIVSADIQVGNSTPGTINPRKRTSLLYKESFQADIDSIIPTMTGYRVYSLSLGDMTHDTWWYESATQWGIPQYKNMISDFGCPVFHVMGNHDNDPYISGDIAAESTYRKELGPTYYSFNIGSTHYIVMDNIKYINIGGTIGLEGAMDYSCGVTSSQLEWVRSDLATVIDRSTPIVVAMHAPLTESSSLSPAKYSEFENADDVVTLFDGFSNVTILSGHLHTNHNSQYPGRSNIMEHNCAAVSGSLWYNIKGYNGTGSFGACRDGSPMGYTIYEFNGKNMVWHYKGSGLSSDVQFKAYDMNTIDKNYKDKNIVNEILVNVWNWDPLWDVKIYESNTPLNVIREVRKDPDFIKFSKVVYLPTGATGSSGSAATSTHLFSTVTTYASSSVRIEITDRFGKKYSQQLR